LALIVNPEAGAMDSPLKRAIKILTIPVLWERLGLPGHVSGNCCVKSPLRDDDRTPSFSIYSDGRRWKDHGTGEGGDSFDLYQAVTRTNARTAWRAFIELST
jgi:hypothetical protein